MLQAYLEADPASRTAKDEYVMRYQRFAKADLEKAIQKYEGLHETIGEHHLHWKSPLDSKGRLKHQSMLGPMGQRLPGYEESPACFSCIAA